MRRFAALAATGALGLALGLGVMWWLAPAGPNPPAQVPAAPRSGGEAIAPAPAPDLSGLSLVFSTPANSRHPARAYLAREKCGAALGYAEGDVLFEGVRLAGIRGAQVILETPQGLRTLAQDYDCTVPALDAAASPPPVVAPARREYPLDKVIGQMMLFSQHPERAEQLLEEGRIRRESMTQAERDRYALQSNPECWPEEVPPGKSELEIIPEYCY